MDMIGIFSLIRKARISESDTDLAFQIAEENPGISPRELAELVRFDIENKKEATA